MFHRPNSTPSQTPTSTQTPGQAPNKENASMNAPTNNSANNTASETPATDASAEANRSVDIPAPGANAGGNPFQRTTTPAGASPAANPSRPAMPSYGGGYPSYGTPSATAAGAAQGRRLVIGEGITMSGEIESCDVLVVEGTVEAALKGASSLEISEKGMFYGTVEINEATIAGKFEGDLTVNGRLTIRATGSITGAISYKELAVEAGATIDGKINPVGGSRAVATDKKSRGNKSSANTTEDLPMLQRAAG